ncbi:MAG TPA: ABC transporter permease [Candidatus Peregrinibacteria bacterium]|nr:ABC transporter permease [Candidatus Peregrinibacteria bacterium]
MNTILVLAKNTFREAIRDRVMYIILFFAALMILSTFLLGTISLGQEAKITQDIGLSAISIFGVIITIFIGSRLLFKEIDRHTIYTILSKPVTRTQFILGKFIGLGLVLLVVTLIMALVFLGIVWIQGTGFKFILLQAIFLSYLEFLLLLALAIFFSTFTSPLVTTFCTFLLFIIGHMTEDLLVFAEQSQSIVFQKIINTIYYIVPNLENFNLKNEIVYNLGYSLGKFGLVLLYFLLFTGLILFFAGLIFKKQEI